MDRMLAAGDARMQRQRTRPRRLREASDLIRRRCREAGIGITELQAGSRRRPIALVRTKLAVQLVTRVGLSLADAARTLGVSTSGIAKAIGRCLAG